jgi:hypothetical protein
MKKTILALLLFWVALVAAPVFTQTLSPHAMEIKAKVEKRSRESSRSKVKLESGVSYTGMLSEAGDTSFTVTTNGGDRHVVRYSEVTSVGGTGGLSTGAKIGLGIAIGAGVVLAVLAGIIHSND